MRGHLQNGLSGELAVRSFPVWAASSIQDQWRRRGEIHEIMSGA
jgi:hypothetical protein